MKLNIYIYVFFLSRQIQSLNSRYHFSRVWIILRWWGLRTCEEVKLEQYSSNQYSNS